MTIASTVLAFLMTIETRAELAESLPPLYLSRKLTYGEKRSSNHETGEEKYPALTVTGLLFLKIHNDHML